MIRTSETHPLQVDWINCSPAHGRIGMTFCPGKIQNYSMTGGWQRNAKYDLNKLLAAGTTHLMCLLDEHELCELSVPNLPALTRELGMGFINLPIEDAHTPVHEWESSWFAIRPEIINVCKTGKLVIFCKGGLGRTGLYAALLLQDLGMSAGEAIRCVRETRKGTIETSQQLNYVMLYKRPMNLMSCGISRRDDGES